MLFKSKKTQVTIFLIIGVVLVIIVTSIIFLTKYAVNKKSKQETINVKEAAFDIQPINNFVTECLSIVAKDALKKLGKQGGKLYMSQKGPVPDYIDEQEGYLYINYYDGSKIAYNIVPPMFSREIRGIIYTPSIPDYPWRTFPYDENNEEKFEAKGVFGINTLSPLTKSFDSIPMQEQLEVYVKNNIDSCLDLSLFKDFEISKKENNITVNINENDVVFIMNQEIEIQNIITEQKTNLNEFIVKHNVRLGKLHRFVNRLIEDDTSNVTFDITNPINSDNFYVRVETDIFGHDDIIIVTDQISSFDNIAYEYSFARKNRNPALFLLPNSITLSQAEITTLAAQQELKALDPDEDSITPSSFSLELLPSNNYKVKVTDGNLEDYQIITISIS